MQHLPYFCGKDCGGDACPLLAKIEDGRAVVMEHNPAAGKWITPCGKGMRAHIDHYAPHRLTTPLIRTGPRGSGKFREASWDEALHLIAGTIARIRKESGPDSMMSIASAGSTGALHNTEVMTMRFFNALGGGVGLSGNYSSNAANFAIKQMFGTSAGESGFDAATLEYSELIVLWGANPLEARLGAELPMRLLHARKRGAHVVVIDPRRSRTARALNAEWIGIQPGSDPAFGYALLYEIMRHKDFDECYVEARAEGFSTLRDYVDGRLDGIVKDAEWAAGICGIKAETLRRLAALWWERTPVMLIPGYSIQRIAYGEESFRLAVAIQLATQNSGVRGASSGSINNRLPGVRVGRLDEIPSKIDRSALFEKKVPILRWADAVLHPERYGVRRIRLLYSAGGNFLNQGANILKNIEAFNAVDFMVSHELYMTPTAARSDVILPVADSFEKEDIGIPWAGDYVLYKPKIFDSPPEVRTDYHIFTQLSEMSGVAGVFTEHKTEAQWIDQFISESEIDDADTFKKNGIFIKPQRYRAGLDNFFKEPQRYPLGTEGGKIIFSSPLWSSRRSAFLESRTSRDKATGSDTVEFSLLSPKIAEYVHSQRRRVSHPLNQGSVHLHPSDLELLGGREGDILEVKGGSGIILARAETDSNMRRGVIWIEEGIWTNPHGSIDPNGSVNMLTSEIGTEESTSCIMHDIRVSVKKCS